MSGRTRERQVFKVVIDFNGHTAGIAECQVTGMLVLKFDRAIYV